MATYIFVKKTLIPSLVPCVSCLCCISDVWGVKKRLALTETSFFLFHKQNVSLPFIQLKQLVGIR